ncbi:MAG: glycosyltransferase [Candidatus Acidiferrum sp.]
MNPLLVDLEMEWRGGQNQALLILKGLYERGHLAELVAAKGSALARRASASGICVHYVERGVAWLPAVLKIRDLLRSGRIDLVHANESHALTAAWLARAHRRVPLLFSRRVGYPLRQNWISRRRFIATSKIIAVSNWVATQVEASGVPPEKIFVLYEGENLHPVPTPDQRAGARSTWGLAPDAFVLGCVGVFLPDKNQDKLIRALALLRQEFPSMMLLLAGDGPCRVELEALARELGVIDAVIFAGFLKDVRTVYATLDMFLFPSLFEGLGTSLLAAMSYGIPSMAFRRCAFPEIIEHEKSGLLAEEPEIPAIMAAIRRVATDREFAQRLGEAARKQVEMKFSADGMVENILGLYEDVWRK